METIKSLDDPLVYLSKIKKPLTVRETASFCQVSPKFIRQLIKEGELLADKISTGYQIKPADLLAYLRRKSDPQIILLK